MLKGIKKTKNYLLQHRLKRILENKPSLYVQIQRWRYAGKRYSRKIVNSNTDIVIEGYPRSANSFSVKAFKFANGNQYKIATHQHASPQVVEAVKMSIPTIVLIRKPQDAVLSYAALRAATHGLENFRSGYDMRWLLEDYIAFYENVRNVRNGFLLATFEEVLSDYGAVIEKVNQKFNTDFNAFEHTDENVSKVFSSAKKHLSPSEERDAIKKVFEEEMERLKKTDTYAKAQQVYQAFINH
ncbi:hypothetical protein MG296_13710 [Flavobacteriaceae bacterium TK19130]|nr:hypothetical protein [Thermobacterium salinum]